MICVKSLMGCYLAAKILFLDSVTDRMRPYFCSLYTNLLSLDRVCSLVLVFLLILERLECLQSRTLQAEMIFDRVSFVRGLSLA